MSSKQIARIPISIKGKDPEDLSRRCLENNIRFQTEFHYFDISKVGTEWVAWYYADITKFKVLSKIKDMTNV